MSIVEVSLIIMFYVIPLLLGLVTCVYCIVDKEVREAIECPFTTKVFLWIFFVSFLPVINAILFYSGVFSYIGNSKFMNKVW